MALPNQTPIDQVSQLNSIVTASENEKSPIWGIFHLKNVFIEWEKTGILLSDLN
jgi:hypothetical protein